MSKKVKISVVLPLYFSETRSYQSVANAEATFFKALIANKDDLGTNNSVRQAISTVGRFILDPLGTSLDVLVEFYVNDPRSGQAQRMFLGTKLSPSISGSEPQITHFFCLGDDTGFLTKIHHDRDFNPNATEKKPSSHIQIGGRISQSLRRKMDGACCWNENLDKPRVPSIPFCTALLWHWAFLEYQESEQITTIFQAPWWNRIVQEAESAILKPFFDDGLRLINNKPAQRFFNAFYEAVPK